MKFISKVRELRLIKKPSDRIVDEQRRVFPIRGERAEFSSHIYKTDDPEMIEWLRNHPLYGVDFVSAEIEKPIPQKPKVVTWDETIERDSAVKMVAGARSTVMVPKPEPSIPPLYPPTLITKDEVVQLVDSRMQAMDQKIDKLLNMFGGVPPTAPKPKMRFHCPVPGCGKEFKTGFDVGKHKKIEHPELTG